MPKAEWFCNECGTELKAFTLLWVTEHPQIQDAREYWAGYCPNCDSIEGVDLWRSEYEQETEDVDTCDEYVRSQGYDPDDLVRRTQERIKDALDNSPLNPRNNGEADHATQ